MAETMTKEEGKILDERNPLPVAQREIQTLEVGAGEPKAPETAKSEKPKKDAEVDDSANRIAALEAEVAKFRDVMSKKDKAIADAKAEAAKVVQLDKDEDAQEPDIAALVDERVAQKLEERLAAKMKELEPRFSEVDKFGTERALASLEGDIGREAVEQYRDAALEQRKAIPGLSLAQAYRLVMPEGASKAPETPVESSRSPAPASGQDREKRAAEKLAEARGLNSRTARLRRDIVLEDYVRAQAPGVFPDREKG